MCKVVHVLSPVGIYFLGDGSATKIHNGLDAARLWRAFVLVYIYIGMLNVLFGVGKQI